MKFIIKLIFFIIVLQWAVLLFVTDSSNNMTDSSSAISFQNTVENHSTAAIRTTENNNQEVKPEWIHSSSDVVIVMGTAQVDRMGSQFRQIFSLSAFADCHGYNFCVSKDSGQKYAEEFGIPFCPNFTKDQLESHNSFGINREREITEPGIYHFRQSNQEKKKFIQYILKSHKDQEGCLWSKPFKQYWRKNLLQVTEKGVFKNSEIANKNLFTSNTTSSSQSKVITIAVHVRRGDITSDRRRDIFVSDNVWKGAIRSVRDLMVASNRMPEVHLFSENYGTTNWTHYTGLVDHWHLAPRMNHPLRGQRMDWDLNVRDWKHFLKADVLLIGGSFSWIPGSIREAPDPKTGLPLTFQLCSTQGYFGDRCGDHAFLDVQEIKYKYEAKFAGASPIIENVELLNLPSMYKNYYNDMKNKNK